MSLDSPPLVEAIRKAACAIETTTGTKASLGATDAITRLFDPTIKYTTEKVERPTNSMAPQGSRPGLRRADSTWGNEFTSASTLPHWVRYLRMAGFSDAGVAKVFKPVFPSIVTGTFGTYRPGRFKCSVGTVTNGVLTLTRGQPGRWNWTGVGVQGLPDSSTTVSAITYEDISPLYVGATFSVGSGDVLTVPSVEIDLGNQMVLREDITAVDSAGNPTGARSGYISALQPTVKMSPEALSLAARDWFADHRTQADIAMTITLGSASSKCVITAAKMHLDDDPDETSDNGMLRDSLVFVPAGDETTPYLTFDFTPDA